VKSGYRPNHVFEYKENGQLKEAFMGDLQIEGNGFIELGKEYEVMIRFPLVQRIERFMNKGRKWWIHEASRQLGEAEIIEFEMPKGE